MNHLAIVVRDDGAAPNITSVIAELRGKHPRASADTLAAMLAARLKSDPCLLLAASALLLHGMPSGAALPQQQRPVRHMPPAERMRRRTMVAASEDRRE